MRKNVRTLISETKYAKEACPRCDGKGYWQGGVDGDYFDCDHIHKEYKDSLFVRTILQSVGYQLLECKLTESQKESLSQFLLNSGIDYEFI